MNQTNETKTNEITFSTVMEEPNRHIPCGENVLLGSFIFHTSKEKI